MKEITSLQNSQIKDIVRLHTPRGRKEQNLFIIEGFRAIQTVLEKFPIEQLYITGDQYTQATELCPIDKITLVTPEIMAKISTATTPSGMLAISKIPKQIDLNSLDTGLVLAQITDPGNMGTLIRTAAACALKTVIIIEDTDPWGPKVVAATAGTIAQVNIFEITWDELIAHKKELELYGLVVHTGQDIRVIKSQKHLLVIGNESTGIPEVWQKQCDKLITLPMPGGTESLNAAVAGSIAVYTLSVLKNF